MNRIFFLLLIPDFLNVFKKKIDLMVPAAKKAHPPKYKLFGGMSESDSFF